MDTGTKESCCDVIIYYDFSMVSDASYSKILDAFNRENRIDGCVRIADHRCTDVDCIHSFFIKKINGYKTPVYFRNALVPKSEDRLA